MSTSHSVPDTQNANVTDGVLSHNPLTTELIEAAEALAARWIVNERATADAEAREICTVCGRGSLRGLLYHTDRCLIGNVMRAVEKLKLRRAGTFPDGSPIIAADQTPTAEQVARGQELAETYGLLAPLGSCRVTPGCVLRPGHELPCTAAYPAPGEGDAKWLGTREAWRGPAGAAALCCHGADVCEYCGPVCRGGAAHTARAEDGVKFGSLPGELSAAAPERRTREEDVSDYVGESMPARRTVCGAHYLGDHNPDHPITCDNPIGHDLDPQSNHYNRAVPLSWPTKAALEEERLAVRP